MAVSLEHAERFLNHVADQPDLPNALPGANDTRDAFRAIRDELARARAEAASPDRDAVLRAIHYWTGSPDRCDMEGREDEVADTVLAALQGKDLDEWP